MKICLVVERANLLPCLSLCTIFVPRIIGPEAGISCLQWTMAVTGNKRA